MKIRTPPLRMAFPALWEPDAIGEGQPAWGARFIIEPDSPMVQILDDAMEKVANEKWKAKGPTVLASLIKKGDVCFVKGEYANKDGEVYDGFHDNFYLGTRNPDAQPLVIDRDKSVLEKKHGRPYSGCKVIASVDIWAQDNQFGRGIRAKLLGVQFYEDGDAFAGGGVAKADDFENLAGGADDEAPEGDFDDLG